MKDKLTLKLLSGDELIAFKSRLDRIGFNSVVIELLEKLRAGKIDEITKCEVDFISKKLGGN